MFMLYKLIAPQSVDYLGSIGSTLNSSLHLVIRIQAATPTDLTKTTYSFSITTTSFTVKSVKYSFGVIDAYESERRTALTLILQWSLFILPAFLSIPLLFYQSPKRQCYWLELTPGWLFPFLIMERYSRETVRWVCTDHQANIYTNPTLFNFYFPHIFITSPQILLLINSLGAIRSGLWTCSSTHPWNVRGNWKPMQSKGVTANSTQAVQPCHWSSEAAARCAEPICRSLSYWTSPFV